MNKLKTLIESMLLATSAIELFTRKMHEKSGSEQVVTESFTQRRKDAKFIKKKIWFCPASRLCVFA
ncbi:MAG TPA: hypothetical protein VIK62_02225 [Verrucomicrobiae bacterium]